MGAVVDTDRAWDLVLRASANASVYGRKTDRALRIAVESGEVTIAFHMVDTMRDFDKSTAEPVLARTHRFVELTPRTCDSWDGETLYLVERKIAEELTVLSQQRAQLFGFAMLVARSSKVVLVGSSGARTRVTWSAPLPGEQDVQSWTYDNPNEGETTRLLGAGAIDKRKRSRTR